MRVYLKTSSKSQVTSPQSPIPSSTPLYYLDIGEILKIPSSKSHVPRTEEQWRIWKIIGS